MGIEGTGGSERSRERQAVRKPYVVEAGYRLLRIGSKTGGRKLYVIVSKEGAGNHIIRKGTKTGGRKSYVVVPRGQAGNRIFGFKAKTGIGKPGSFEYQAEGREVDRLARSLTIAPEEMPTAAAELKIVTLPSETWHSSHSEEQERKGPHDPGMPAAEGSS